MPECKVFNEKQNGAYTLVFEARSALSQVPIYFWLVRPKASPGFSKTGI